MVTRNRMSLATYVLLTYYILYEMALTLENLSWGVWEKQRHRPACASAQTDQGLCNSLLGKYHI